jgi:hypothetical protein
MLRFLLGFVTALLLMFLFVRFSDIGLAEWLAVICKLKGHCPNLGGIF